MGLGKYSGETTSAKYKKDPLENEATADLVDSLLEKPSEEQNKLLNKALDKILVTHRNSRLFLLMITGPFFIAFSCVKYAIKLLILAYIYKKNIGKKEPSPMDVYAQEVRKDNIKR